VRCTGGVTLAVRSRKVATSAVREEEHKRLLPAKEGRGREGGASPLGNRRRREGDLGRSRGEARSDLVRPLAGIAFGPASSFQHLPPGISPASPPHPRDLSPFPQPSSPSAAKRNGGE